MQIIFDRFQPTCPVRGTTRPRGKNDLPHLHFNPRAPCGARLSQLTPESSGKNFNPRAPCGARPHRAW